MPSKKKLKRRNKKLKNELAEREEMYEALQVDYHGYVNLYHDAIKLFAEFDPELLSKVVKATLRDCDKANLATRIAASEPGDTIYIQGKASGTRAWINGGEAALKGWRVDG